MAAQTDGEPGAIVRAWKDQADYAWIDVVSPNHRDLGVGVAGLGGVPLYVLYFALSAKDAFAAKTAPLRDLSAVREALLSAVNRERAAAELRPLSANARLNAAAQAHADDMIARGFYGHASPEGEAVLARARRAGYPVWKVGENIASGQTEVVEVMDGWMDSPEHRENILAREFREAGFGVAMGRMPEGYRVLWVQVFGVQRRR